jgi:two-component system, OmpR family, sensor histidine kinase RstB
MRRLYFRIILGVLVILILAFSLPAVIFDRLGRRDDGSSFAGPMTGTIELLKHRLECVAPAQIERELDSLEVLLDFPVKLVDSGDSSLPGEIGFREITARDIGEGFGRGRQMFFVALRNTGKVLVMGPTPSPPSADTRSIIILVSFVLMIVGVAGFLMISPLVRNLKALEITTSRFGDGDWDSRAIVKRGDVVGSVAQQFNLMADRIQRLIQRERQLLQSVSHELRTPIARIRFSLDMLNDAKTREEQQRRVQEIDGEICEIDQLVGELLDFNRIQSESTPLDLQRVPVRPLLEEVVRRLHDFRPTVGIEIVAGDEAQCPVRVDRLLFRRAIQNLVSNALRYARSQIVVRYSREQSATLVEVCDDGPGIPPEQHEQIMQPFFHGDERSNKVPGGAGLGLAIVRRIVALHGGSITIENTEIGGARFLTRWPDGGE